MLSGTAVQFVIKIIHSRDIKLAMSTCSVTCPELKYDTDSSSWPKLSPNPDVSGIGVWLSILIPPFVM